MILWFYSFYNEHVEAETSLNFHRFFMCHTLPDLEQLPGRVFFSFKVVCFNVIIRKIRIYIFMCLACLADTYVVSQESKHIYEALKIQLIELKAQI